MSFCQAEKRRTRVSRRRVFVFSCVIPLLFVTASGYVHGSEVANYPVHPVNFIIPLPPGGASELAIRLFIKGAEKHLGQPIVPINKPGGGLTIGVAETAKAKPDGYTIGFSAFGPMTVTPFLQQVPYHPINDFRQVMQFGTFNSGLVVYADSPFRSLPDVIAAARQSKKKLTFGAVAIGLNMTIMKKIAEKEGVEFAPMPFGSAGQAEIALLGKHIDMVAGDFNNTFIEAGQTRLLAMFRDERSDEYPQVPILKELGYNIPCRMFMAVHGPKGMSDAVVKKLEDAFTKAMNEPEFIKGMKDLRFPIYYRNSKQLTEYLVASYELYREFLK
jgi:tripartite-type tricarboxylate transporter receptor subunit TctC